jgi:predicted DNA binding CopG/RHH family protein
LGLSPSKSSNLRHNLTVLEGDKPKIEVNIRLTSCDLLNIRQIAAYEGLPYQTLIASVLHKYAAGHLN